MSYNFNSPCYLCNNKSDCQDFDKIRKAIDEIHHDRETHKGSGSILMMCTKVDTTKKEVPNEQV